MVSWKNRVLLLRFSNFHILIHSFKLPTCDIMVSISTFFEYIFWFVSHLVMKLSQLTDIITGNIFRKSFAWYGGLGPGPRFRPSLIYQPTAVNQIMISLWIFTLSLMMCTETIKNGEDDFTKMNRSHYITILSKSLNSMAEASFQSS